MGGLEGGLIAAKVVNIPPVVVVVAVVVVVLNLNTMNQMQAEPMSMRFFL